MYKTPTPCPARRHGCIYQHCPPAPLEWWPLTHGPRSPSLTVLVGVVTAETQGETACLLLCSLGRMTLNEKSWSRCPHHRNLAS